MTTLVRTRQDIARDIRTEFELANTCAHNAVQHAIKCGRMLTEAKEGLDHGQWLPWLTEHFPSTPRTASNYMRLAANEQSVSDLPVAKGLRVIAARDAEEPQSSSNRELTRLMRSLGPGEPEEQIIDAEVVEDDVDPAVAKLIATVETTLTQLRGTLHLNAESGRAERARITRAAREALSRFIEKPA